MTEQFREIRFSDEQIAALKQADEYIHKGTVSVDYVDKEAIINGVGYDKGQIACDILNIPEKVLCGLYELNNDFLPLFYRMVYSGSENTIPAEAIQKSAGQALYIADTLSKYKPFSYFGKEGFIKDYSMLSKNSTDISNNWSTVFGPSSQIFISIASAFNIAGSLMEFRNMIMPIIEEADSDDYERTVIGYARAFDKYFKEAKASNGKWLPFAVVYQESIVKNGIFGKKLEFMQFSEMIASDFVEGLTVGHAPKKCRMCGRYFLTTNAHHPHYCNEVNPDDPRDRTCRKLAKLKGSTEKPEDNPRLIIKKKALANMRQAKSRGTISEYEAAVIQQLIIDKSERAAERSDYCNGSYAAEMKMRNLIKEATLRS